MTNWLILTWWVFSVFQQTRQSSRQSWDPSASWRCSCRRGPGSPSPPSPQSEAAPPSYETMIIIFKTLRRIRIHIQSTLICPGIWTRIRCESGSRNTKDKIDRIWKQIYHNKSTSDKSRVAGAVIVIVIVILIVILIVIVMLIVILRSRKNKIF